MKKAQGLPLNTVILAAIAIVVLVVVLLFFTGKFKQSSDALNDCESKNGYISTSAKCEDGGIPTLISSKEPKQYCCIKLTNS